MSIPGINARSGHEHTVYRPTVTDDTITWGTAILTALKLEFMPVTNEVARQVFGADVRVEVMALSPTANDIRKGDGFVTTAGPYNGAKWRVSAALPFRKFTQLALHQTTEAIG